MLGSLCTGLFSGVQWSGPRRVSEVLRAAPSLFCCEKSRAPGEFVTSKPRYRSCRPLPGRTLDMILDSGRRRQLEWSGLILQACFISRLPITCGHRHPASKKSGICEGSQTASSFARALDRTYWSSRRQTKPPHNLCVRVSQKRIAHATNYWQVV